MDSQELLENNYVVITEFSFSRSAQPKITIDPVKPIIPSSEIESEIEKRLQADTTPFRINYKTNIRQRQLNRFTTESITTLYRFIRWFKLSTKEWKLSVNADAKRAVFIEAIGQIEKDNFGVLLYKVISEFKSKLAIIEFDSIRFYRDSGTGLTHRVEITKSLGEEVIQVVMTRTDVKDIF